MGPKVRALPPPGGRPVVAAKARSERERRVVEVAARGTAGPALVTPHEKLDAFPNLRTHPNEIGKRGRK